MKYLKRAWEYRWIFRVMLNGKMKPPTSAVIDTATVCNLKCPFCPTGNRSLKRIMKLEEFRTILDRLPLVKLLCLHNWGEPLLNPELPQIIAYAKGKGVEVEFDSNLSLPLDDGRISALVSSGLDRLTVSLDGASPASYSKYRVGGDFDLIIDNIKRIQAERTRIGANHPAITWKFIINRFNEHEIDTARKHAEQLGVVFNLAKMGIPEKDQDEWMPSEPYRLERSAGLTTFPRSFCIWLFKIITVSADGSVLPCCYSNDIKYSFGNILKDPLESVWNNDLFRYSRSLVFPVLFKPRITETVRCVGCRTYSSFPGAFLTRMKEAVSAIWSD